MLRTAQTWALSDWWLVFSVTGSRFEADCHWSFLFGHVVVAKAVQLRLRDKFLITFETFRLSRLGVKIGVL